MITIKKLSRNQLQEEAFFSVNVYDAEEQPIDGFTGKEYVRIDHIHVDREDRGKGLGKKLLSQAKAEAMSYGLPVFLVAMDLDDDIDLERLVSWYEQEGFRIIGPAGDGVVMAYRG